MSSGLTLCKTLNKNVTEYKHKKIYGLKMQILRKGLLLLKVYHMENQNEFLHELQTFKIEIKT